MENQTQNEEQSQDKNQKGYSKPVDDGFSLFNMKDIELDMSLAPSFD